MEVILSKDGHKVPVINGIPLHSKYEPLKEAHAFIKDSEQDKLIVVLGLGFGYHLNSFKNLNNLTVIEPDNQLTNACFVENPVTSGISILNGSPNDIVNQLDKVFEQSDPRSIVLKFHTPSCKARPELYGPYEQALKNWLEQKLLNTITDSYFGKLWFINAIRNLKLNPRALSVRNLNRAPAVILGSGFSLTETLPLVRKNRKYWLIIAIPPVLQALEANGIDPDMVVLVDAGYANRHYLKDCKAPLLTYLSSSNQFIKNWKGPVFFMNSALPVEQYLIPEFPLLPISGSAAATALEIAKMLSREVIISGFDFSYTGKYYHYRGNPLEKALLYQSDKKNPAMLQLNNLMHKNHNCFVPGRNGSRILSNTGMFTYYKDFCGRLNSPEHSFYLLTENTADFPGTAIWKGNSLNEKKQIEFESVSIDINMNERIRLLKEAYQSRNLQHPAVKLHLSRCLLKNESIDAEIEKGLQLLNRFETTTN